MLGLLLGLALVLSALVSLLPAEWQDGPFMPTPPGLGRAEPAPRPALTPGSAGSVTGRAGDGRAGFRVFLPFGLERNGAAGLTLHLASLLTFLVLGLLALYLLPARVGRVALALRTGWGGRLRLAALGLAVAALGFAFGALSVLTVVGAPLWVVLLALSYFGGLLGLAAISLPLGRLLGRGFGLAEQPPQVDLLAGLLVLFIVSLLPFVGGPLLVLAALPGLGAVLQTRAGSARPWSFNLPEMEY